MAVGSWQKRIAESKKNQQPETSKINEFIIFAFCFYQFFDNILN